eukprot:CAMPEP_0171293194 /NCGR_PEP_ID=MMETSP0816-20121228/1374_1 /TAXON_ID=420281 /ORGANISM="Proboscia inermis, Strain CCAP1064/1" /LENGTH=433 /DNA_ID=CAMNT_0011763785 /DNA_START=35 /DNA_END=1336 /DNA_ORIENTATION=-
MIVWKCCAYSSPLVTSAAAFALATKRPPPSTFVSFSQRCRSSCGARVTGTPSFHRKDASSGTYILNSPTNLFSTSSGQLSSVKAINPDKARLLFLGTPDVAAASLATILRASNETDAPFEVVGVVTQPPKRRKRRGAPEPSPVGKIAEGFGIPVLCPEKAKDPDFLDDLENNYKPDLCITAAYGQYLPKRFLAIPSLGTLNIHPSLLPRWRGASPVQRSLEAGDDPIGVTVLFTVSKMDAGALVAQKEYNVGPDEQSADVLPYLFGLGTTLLLDSLPKVISGEVTMENAKPQEEELVVAADMINASEGELRYWSESATTCHNKIRAFSIWPGTFMHVKVGDNTDPVKVKVIKSRVVEGTVDKTRTIELKKEKGAGLLVVCNDGSVLELLQVQPECKKVMDAKSFHNGLRGGVIEWLDMSNSGDTVTTEKYCMT